MPPWLPWLGVAFVFAVLALIVWIGTRRQP